MGGQKEPEEDPALLPRRRPGLGSVGAGQSSEKAALIYQHSDEDRQREVAAGLDDLVRAERAKPHTDDRAHHEGEASAG
ncbi:hypothetical protein GCM10010310_12410 [Streptomyces violaceolatus]|uniref:Uncharacterized protein n=1 Tax=Streptomyces violaceolatus TaxID=67378 RepID=A0ABN3SCZ8_9ACTN